ncbi:MAG: hypothetical protein DRG78_19255 [Epsilonproteobacteria bacterium]|nr:MAG: hypothetical protein DRG78_19255 [Campylobacterota bacterium]
MEETSKALRREKMKLFILLLALLTTINTQAKTLEIYFDTPDLFNLKNGSSVKYQAVSYISKKKKKIRYHENIIYTYDTNKTKIFPVKHYNSVKSVEEKHPLLALVKRKDRELFMTVLKNNGLTYPLKLRYILETIDSNATYKELFKVKSKDNYLFNIKFQYPYLLNLFYSIIFGLSGLILIYILFRKRLKV